MRHAGRPPLGIASPVLLLAFVLAPAGCETDAHDGQGTGASSRPTHAAAAAAAAAAERPFDDLMRSVAAEYPYFDSDGGGGLSLSSIADCAPPPPPPPPPVAHMSRSRDESTHGRKLFRVYASDVDAYREGREPDAGAAKQAAGSTPNLDHCRQILVKEAFVPVVVQDANPAADDAPVRHGGVLYRPGERTALFVMAQLDPAAPGTDAGWVYGTIAADGRTVTSSGLVKSCMDCHQDAGPGRLFGLPKETGTGN